MKPAAGLLASALNGVALWAVYVPVRWTSVHLPAEAGRRFARALAVMHARWAGHGLPRRIRRGVASVWGDRLGTREIERVVHGNLVTRYLALLDTFRYGAFGARAVREAVSATVGTGDLDAALAKGRGVILLLSHVGSTVMLLAALAERGYRMRVVVALTAEFGHRTSRWLERRVMRAKLSCWRHERVEIELWRPGVSLRRLYRALARGEIVVVHGDAARGGRFVRAPFLGRVLTLPAGPFVIAERTGAAVVPAFIVRDADGRQRVLLEPGIAVGRASWTVEDAAAQYADRLGAQVSARPEQWLTWARLTTSAADGRCLELTTGLERASDFYAAGRAA